MCSRGRDLPRLFCPHPSSSSSLARLPGTPWASKAQLKWPCQVHQLRVRRGLRGSLRQASPQLRPSRAVQRSRARPKNQSLPQLAAGSDPAGLGTTLCRTVRVLPSAALSLPAEDHTPRRTSSEDGTSSLHLRKGHSECPGPGWAQTCAVSIPQPRRPRPHPTLARRATPARRQHLAIHPGSQDFRLRRVRRCLGLWPLRKSH